VAREGGRGGGAAEDETMRQLWGRQQLEVAGMVRNKGGRQSLGSVSAGLQRRAAPWGVMWCCVDCAVDRLGVSWQQPVRSDMQLMRVSQCQQQHGGRACASVVCVDLRAVDGASRKHNCLLLCLLLQVSIAKPLEAVSHGWYVTLLCVTTCMGLGLLTSARAGPAPLTLWWVTATAAATAAAAATILLPMATVLHVVCDEYHATHIADRQCRRKAAGGGFILWGVAGCP